MLEFVTTIKNADDALVSAARAAARELNLHFLERSSIILKNIITGNAACLVFEQRGPALHTSLGVHRFHLNLAGLRIINLERGLGDNMVKAMNLNAGAKVLDCTLGLASDAIVAAYASGAGGYVHGCEQSLPLYCIAKHGLNNHQTGNCTLDAALRRITVFNCDYRDFLKNVTECRYDVIYFDPMFVRPQHKSSAFAPVRNVVCDLPLETSAIELALQKTGDRVVVKLEQHSRTAVNFDAVVGGKHSAVRYGVLYRR